MVGWVMPPSVTAFAGFRQWPSTGGVPGRAEPRELNLAPTGFGVHGRDCVSPAILTFQCDT